MTTADRRGGTERAPDIAAGCASVGALIGASLSPQRGWRI